MRRFRIVSNELEREVGFAGGVQFGRATGINAPATVGELFAADVVGELGDARGLGFAENVEIVDVVGFESAVGFEFAEPIAGVRLKREKVFGALIDGVFET
jgi:hypothetical protein